MPITYPRLTQDTASGRARAAALAQSSSHTDELISVVTYQSTGKLVIISDDDKAFEVAAEFDRTCHCTVIIRGDAPLNTSQKPANNSALSLHITPTSVSGYLGAFEVLVSSKQGECNLTKLVGLDTTAFDLVLDLTTPAYIDSELSPPGYFAPRGDPRLLEKALQEIPQLIGEFEKPTYFKYKLDICVHGNSELTGCRRCLDACPADAIQSLKDRIEVNPYLCQGEGICTTVCPSGALTYTTPSVDDLLQGIKTLLKTYREAQGIAPCLIFHDAEAGYQRIQALSPALPERVIPWQIESPGATGLDVWLATLAYGASGIALLTTKETAPAVTTSLALQVRIAQALITGMGHPAAQITLLHDTDDAAITDKLEQMPTQTIAKPASFATANEKRNTLRMAIGSLYGQAENPAGDQTLPNGAPFGEIQVDTNACTLCMACVSVCPSSALIDGKDAPRLSFIEWNCTQCGLCEKACPEDAISLSPRFVYATQQRETRRLLNEEQPFCCVSCGKPFASSSMISRITEKLQGHWMFQDEAAIRRLQMCEDCRVADIYSNELTRK